MVDKYGTGQDPGCYPNTSILINSLNIKDENDLEIAERDITTLSAKEVGFQPPPYNFDYLCYIHEKLFQELYPWAGQIRTVDISKGTTHFCNIKYIQKEADKLFNKFSERDYFQILDRKDLIPAISEFYGDLNMIHPFREGNGRTQRIFFEHVIANMGYEIYWAPIEKEEWITANIAAVVCDYKPLELILEKSLGASN
ncbi:MAG: cell filamentation protein Fic [SAR86 cluster bacterium]|uniref:protein adenylyltransferase n=1 Tax=SAR86 cluster bacterium TaxID=2030880 RepID=A0A2A5B4E0_9GAMM|nr:MAG: cell filamentation protein Fic [SAR86 cluster bacterium]